MLTFGQPMISQGLEQSQRAILLRQLSRRFGTLPAHATARVERATPAELELWADRIFDAVALDDVFAD